MNKNRFNFRCFWQLLSWHFTDNRRTVTYVVSGTLLLCVVVILFKVLFGTVSPWMEKVPFEVDKTVLLASEGASYSGYIVAIAMYVFVSYVFVNMSKRSSEIGYLMLPATNVEKWLSRVVYVLVVAAMIQVAGWLAIQICAGIGRIFHVHILIVLPELFDYYTFHDPTLSGITPALLQIFFWMNHAVLIFLLSAYLLGGTIFRRVPWLSTTIIIFGTYLIVVLSAAFCFGYYAFEINHELGPSLKDQFDKNGLPWLFDKMAVYLSYVSIALSIFAVVFVWLSYRLFCRRQLVHKKIKFIR